MKYAHLIAKLTRYIDCSSTECRKLHAALKLFRYESQYSKEPDTSELIRIAQ